MLHGLVLPRALPSGGCALLLARRPGRAGVAPPQHAHAGGGGKRPAAKRRKAAAPPLPVYEGEGSEYFLFARKAEERCAHPHAPFCAPIAALSVARRWMPLGDMVVSEDTQPGLVLAQRCAVTAQRPPRLGIRCCGRLHPVRRSFLTARALGATQVRCPEEGGADEVAHAGAAPRGPGLRARLAAAARTRPRGNQARAISRRCVVCLVLTAAMCAARRRCTRRRRLCLRATPHPSCPRGAFATFLPLLRRKLLSVLPQGEHLACGRHHVGATEAGDASGACLCCPCCHDSMTDALGAQDSFMAMQESSGGRMGFTTKPQS